MTTTPGRRGHDNDNMTTMPGRKDRDKETMTMTPGRQDRVDDDATNDEIEEEVEQAKHVGPEKEQDL